MNTNFRLTDYFKDKILKGQQDKVQMIQVKDNVGYFCADLFIDTHRGNNNTIQLRVELRKDNGVTLALLDIVELNPGETLTLEGVKVLSKFTVE